MAFPVFPPFLIAKRFQIRAPSILQMCIELTIVSHISGCTFSLVKSVAQQMKQAGVETDVNRLAEVTLLLQGCLDTVASGNAQTSFGLWEAAYQQANLAKTALDKASRTLCEVKSAELRDEIAELLSMARRDLRALESNLKMAVHIAS